MTVTTPDRAYTLAPSRVGALATMRDPRLDFFRGLAMFIILVAHTPGNIWTLWIPARFGFSDATEIFVFCSGMASAIAFGRTFDRAGWALGTVRVGYRVWQIYWAHVGTFFAIAAILATIDATGWHDKVYIGSLNLWKFFAEPAQQLVGLLTLRYVPNYFDILPMYMVVLIMMPVFMAIARASLPLLAVISVVIWIFAQRAVLEALGLIDWHLGFPAEPWSDRKWYFNPFGWQLIFFTGFAFMRGWLRPPPVKPWLIGLAIAVLLVNLAYSNIGVRVLGFDFVRGWRAEHSGWFNKSDFGILRYLHFLALAYLSWTAAGEHGARLMASGQGALARLWDEVVALIMKVGQQSLAVFILSMVLAQVNGYLLDVIGRSAFTWALINLTGFGLLIGCAYGVAWIKSQPWRVQR